jgi:hypothetical protein
MTRKATRNGWLFVLISLTIVAPKQRFVFTFSAIAKNILL